MYKYEKSSFISDADADAAARRDSAESVEMDDEMSGSVGNDPSALEFMIDIDLDVDQESDAGKEESLVQSVDSEGSTILELSNGSSHSSLSRAHNHASSVCRGLDVSVASVASLREQVILQAQVNRWHNEMHVDSPYDFASEDQVPSALELLAESEAAMRQRLSVSPLKAGCVLLGPLPPIAKPASAQPWKHFENQVQLEERLQKSIRRSVEKIKVEAQVLPVDAAMLRSLSVSRVPSPGKSSSPQRSKLEPRHLFEYVPVGTALVGTAGTAVNTIASLKSSPAPGYDLNRSFSMTMIPNSYEGNFTGQPMFNLSSMSKSHETFLMPSELPLAIRPLRLAVKNRTTIEKLTRAKAQAKIKGGTHKVPKVGETSPSLVEDNNNAEQLLHVNEPVTVDETGNELGKSSDVNTRIPTNPLVEDYSHNFEPEMSHLHSQQPHAQHSASAPQPLLEFLSSCVESTETSAEYGAYSHMQAKGRADMEPLTEILRVARTDALTHVARLQTNRIKKLSMLYARREREKAQTSLCTHMEETVGSAGLSTFTTFGSVEALPAEINKTDVTKSSYSHAPFPAIDDVSTNTNRELDTEIPANSEGCIHMDSKQDQFEMKATSGSLTHSEGELDLLMGAAAEFKINVEKGRESDSIHNATEPKLKALFSVRQVKGEIVPLKGEIVKGERVDNGNGDSTRLVQTRKQDTNLEKTLARFETNTPAESKLPTSIDQMDMTMAGAGAGGLAGTTGGLLERSLILKGFQPSPATDMTRFTAQRKMTLLERVDRGKVVYPGQDKMVSPNYATIPAPLPQLSSCEVLMLVKNKKSVHNALRDLGASTPKWHSVITTDRKIEVGGYAKALYTKPIGSREYVRMSDPNVKNLK